MGRKVAFVTGASRGIGKACALHLARAGFDVAVTARTLAWFATKKEAFEHNGEPVEAQFFCHDHQLLPGWEGPWVGPAAATKYELAGARLAELEARRRRDLGKS